jgi:hypothetical protein
VRAAFIFGLWLGIGFLIPAATFSLLAAIAVEAWKRASERRYRQRIIREGLYDLHNEAVVRRQGSGDARDRR